MKKLFLLAAIGFLGVISCSKSSDDINDPATGEEVTKASQPKDFVLNNLKLNATTVKEWVSNEGIQKVVFTFFSGDLTKIGSNLTLSAYAYENNSSAAPTPVSLDIDSESSLQLRSDITLPINQVSINKIKMMVTNGSGFIDFDYLLLEPKYYIMGSTTYLSYQMTPYKNGSPVINPNAQVADGDDDLNPSPPAT